MNKQKRTLAADYIIPLVIVIGFVIGSLIYLHKNFNLILCSDESSELILAKLIADGHGLVPNNWYYSTELRIVNNPLLYALIFKFTDNWHTVRMVSQVILYLLVAAGVYAYADSIYCKKLYHVLLAPFLLPTSLDYYRFVLWGGYYVPHIVCSLIGLALAFCYCREKLSKTKRTWIGIGAFLFALVAGSGGPRPIFSLYAPLIMASVLYLLFIHFDRKEDAKPYGKRFFMISLISMIGGMAGYVLNEKVLRRFYTYHKYSPSFVPLSRNVLVRIYKTFKAFFSAFGFQMGGNDMPAPWADIIACTIFVLAVIAIIYAIVHRKEISKEYFLLTMFFLSSGACLVGLYSLTDMSLTVRYIIPTAVFAFSLITLWIKEAHYFKAGLRPILNIGLTLMILINAITTVVYCDVNAHLTNNARDRLKMKDVLLEKGYTYGYASFWEANILTEMSNGAIEMVHWYVGNDVLYGHQPVSDEQYINDVPPTHEWKWLQYTSHTTEKPKGKVFLLFTQDGYSYYDDKDLLSDEQIIYESDVYRVYGFDSYQELKKCIRE